MSEARIVHAVEDERLSCRIVRRVPLRYRDGADDALDRPAFVRSASGLTWLGDRLAVIQDDANFVAIVDPDSGMADAVALPAGAGGRRLFDDTRGNKQDKLDLECTVALSDSPVTLAFGSGSTDRREQVLVWEHDRGEDGVRLVHLPALYRAFREAPGFAGTQLNVEGVIAWNGTVRFFGRGNGAGEADGLRHNATCEVALDQLLHALQADEATLPPLERVTQFDLGAIGGTPLTFTDAALLQVGDGARPHRVLFAAAAEATEDVTEDGDVAGSAIGVLDERDGDVRARYTLIRDERGLIVREKIEGIVPGRDRPGQLLLVVDQDSPTSPSELWEAYLDLGDEP